MIKKEYHKIKSINDNENIIGNPLKNKLVNNIRAKEERVDTLNNTDKNIYNKNIFKQNETPQIKNFKKQIGNEGSQVKFIKKLSSDIKQEINNNTNIQKNNSNGNNVYFNNNDNNNKESINNIDKQNEKIDSLNKFSSPTEKISKSKKDLFINSPSIEEKKIEKNSANIKNEEETSRNKYNNNFNIYNQNTIPFKSKIIHRPSNSVVLSTNNNIVNVYQETNNNEPSFPYSVKNTKKIIINSRPKDYDPQFNFTIHQVEIDQRKNPQNLFIIKSIKSQKSINENDAKINNIKTKRRKSLNNLKFNKTLSPQGFHKEIIDCEGTIVYKKNINFNEQFPPSKNKLKIINIGNPI